MPQAENAKATPIGTGAGTATSTQGAAAQGNSVRGTSCRGTSVRARANLSLPPRRLELGQGNSPSDSQNTPAQSSRTANIGASKVNSAAPRLTELFGRDTLAPASTRHIAPSPVSSSAATAASSPLSGELRAITRAKGGDSVIIGIPIATHPPDSQYISPEELKTFLARGAISTITSNNLAASVAVPVAPSHRVETQLAQPGEVRAFPPRSNPYDGAVPIEGRRAVAATATSVSTLKQALRELRGEELSAHAPRELKIQALIPGVVALAGSSNIYVQDAARSVLAILNDTVQKAPVAPETLLDAERRINKIERGAGTAPAVRRESQSPLVSDSTRLQENRHQHNLGSAQRLLQLGQESLTIITSLHGIQESQGRNPKYTPEHLLSRVTKVIATSVARHVTALSNQLRSDSPAIALHLTQLSRSLSAIASRPGRVDLRAFSLRLEGLLLVLSLHMQSPRSQSRGDNSDASSSELSHHISNHLSALYVHRTGRRPAAPGSMQGKNSDDLIQGTDPNPNPTGGLLVELLVSGASVEPYHQAPNTRSAAEQLAMILRATSL